jgi:hypothetical protein
MPALALFSGLDKQSSPFKRAQDAGGERSHFAPSGIFPLMLVAIERREQRPLCRAVVGLDVDDIHPDTPFAEGALLKAGIGRMVDLENEEGDQFSKQLRWGLRQVCATLGQAEFAFEVSPQAQGYQKVVQHLERREFVFIDDLVVAEHFLRT